MEYNEIVKCVESISTVVNNKLRSQNVYVGRSEISKVVRKEDCCYKQYDMALSTEVERIKQQKGSMLTKAYFTLFSGNLGVYLHSSNNFPNLVGRTSLLGQIFLPLNHPTNGLYVLSFLESYRDNGRPKTIISRFKVLYTERGVQDDDFVSLLMGIPVMNKTSGNRVR